MRTDQIPSLSPFSVIGFGMLAGGEHSGMVCASCVSLSLEIAESFMSLNMLMDVSFLDKQANRMMSFTYQVCRRQTHFHMLGSDSTGPHSREHTQAFQFGAEPNIHALHNHS